MKFITIFSSLIVIAASLVAASCSSNFHAFRLSTTIRNPPRGAVDAGNVPGTARYYLLECATVTHTYPTTGNSLCRSPPGQKLHLCHTPVDDTTGNWTCKDVSKLLTSEYPGEGNNGIKLGDFNGPYRKFKFTWESKLTSSDCFPRQIHFAAVGLAVPEPSTEFGASMAFVAIVAIVTLIVLSYGFYALYRTSKKFEHQQTGGEEDEAMRAAAAGGGGPEGRSLQRHRAKESMNAALSAMGVPTNFRGSLYDEETHTHMHSDQEDEEEEFFEDEDGEEGYGGGGGASVPVPPPASGRTPAHVPFGSSASGLRGAGGGASTARREQLEDDYGDEDDYDDSWTDTATGSDNRRNAGGGGASSGPDRIVLDNNEVHYATGTFVPWFQRAQQQQQQQQGTSAGRRGQANSRRGGAPGSRPAVAGVDRSLNFTDGSNSTPEGTRRPPQASRAARY